MSAEFEVASTARNEEQLVCLRFGDLVENGRASLDNPRRCGFFVRKGSTPHGRINPGPWIELTDGKGDFWRHSLQHGHRLTIKKRETAHNIVAALRFHRHDLTAQAADEIEKLRNTLRRLVDHCDALESQHPDYTLLAEDGHPCLSGPLAEAVAVLEGR